jgi:BlaR1 peptidase M56
MWIAWQLLLQARILRRAQSPAKALEQWINSSALDLGLRSVRIKMSSDVASPFVSCLGWPTLIWPAALSKADKFSRYQAVLAHELAHLARRDHWVMWLELLAITLLWFHPLMWFVRRRLEETRELACDALALESAEIDRGGFAELLLALSSSDRIPLSPAAPLAAGIGSAFHRRLAMLFCDRASGRISLAGLLVAGLFAAAALPGWAQSTTEAKSKPPEAAPPAEAAAAPAAEVKPASSTPAATNDPHRAANAAREGTIGEVKEIQDDVLLVQLQEGKSLPKDTPLFVIRITPTHSEMIGQLRIMKTDGREVVAKLQPQVGQPQVGDQLWPAVRTPQTRANTSSLYGTGSATWQTLGTTSTVPAVQPNYYPRNTPTLTPNLGSNAPLANYPVTRAWVHFDEGGSTFELEDGSKIVARLGEDGRLQLFLEKDGKRQELSKAKGSARTGRSLTPKPAGAATGAGGGQQSRFGELPRTPSPSPEPMPAAQPVPRFPGALAQQAAPPRRSPLLEADLELAKIEVEEKQVLLGQAEERAKKGELSPTDVKLKELELRKAQIRLKQVQLQFDDSKPSAGPAAAPASRP